MMKANKLPRGISDFKSLRLQGYTYVDKTAYIEALEQLPAKYLFFIRPRRFGKSLFLSVLEHYYDAAHADRFEELFEGLYVQDHPTPLRGEYFVLKLNFSGLNTNDAPALDRSFRSAFKSTLERYFYKYERWLPNAAGCRERLRETDEFRPIWDVVFESAAQAGKRIYLIIDEYDHFANDIIAMGDGALYRDIVRAAGFVRDFYEAVKYGTEHGIDRIFMTGVSPIMLDDLTSGFNMATNLTMDPALNEMLGFTESEAAALLERSDIPADELSMEELRHHYNGYLFHEAGKFRVYNPDMILFFLTQWQRLGSYPDQIIDDNVKTDYGRLQRLMQNDSNRRTLDAIIESEQVTADIVPKFSFDLMYEDQYFVSLLFYMGLLTIDRYEKMRLVLRIPNYVIRTALWEYIEKRIRYEFRIQIDVEPLRRAIGQMAYDGTIVPYVRLIAEQIVKPLSNRDLLRFDEKHLKVILFAHLIGSRGYRPRSEHETEHGYIDIFLEKDPRVPDVKYEWLLELKYVKKSDAGQLDKVKEEGWTQLQRYAAGRRTADDPNVRQALIIWVGKDQVEVVER